MGFPSSFLCAQSHLQGAFWQAKIQVDFWTFFGDFLRLVTEEKKNPQRIHKFLSKEMTFRAAVVVATDVVREMQSIQNTYPLATMAVGRSMVAASLMASQLKSQQQVSLYFRGDGPLEMFFAEATHEGQVRGYTPQPQLEMPVEGGELSVSKAIGSGLLSVVHSRPQQKAPQKGTVSLQTGEVGEDVAFYLLQSQQVRSLVALGVKVNSYGLVQGAGGVLIELMPGCPEETVERLESNLKKAGSLSELVSQGISAADLLKPYVDGIEMMELEHPYELAYQCRCSRERLARALVLLGEEEVKSMIANNESAKARCEFCGRPYEIEVSELSELLQKMQSESH